jgi:hypothetical protein
MAEVNPTIDAELKKRGRAAIAAMLTEAVGTNRGATVRLWVQGLPDPDRAYVEDWLGRKEAEEAAPGVRLSSGAGSAPAKACGPAIRARPSASQADFMDRLRQ